MKSKVNTSNQLFVFRLPNHRLLTFLMDVKLAARIAANNEHDIHTHNFPLHCQIVLKP